MDGISLGLKKLIFSKKDSPSTPSSRSGREKKRAFLSNSRRGKRDPSPFEEVKGNCFNLEDKENEGKEIEDLVSAKEEIRDNDEDFEYRERDASGFEEIDWPDLEPESLSVEQNDEKINSASPNDSPNLAVQCNTESPQTVMDGSVDGVFIRGESVGKILGSNLSDKHGLETAESDDMVSENGYFERKKAFLRPEGSAILSLSDSIQDELDDLEVRAERHKPLTKEQFFSFFDSDGRVVDETKLRRIIFKGGVEEEIREDVWQFLFELYPCNSTKREREVMNTEHSIRYKALKARWRPLLKQISLDPKSGVRCCPEWLHKRKISVVLETNVNASEDAVNGSTLEVAGNSRGLLADTRSPSRQEHDLGQEDKEAEQSSGKWSAVAKVSHGTHDPLREGEASFKMADDADIHPIADIHGSTVDDIRDAITEAMMEEPRITRIRSDKGYVKEKKKTVEKGFHSNFKSEINCPICTQEVSSKCLCRNIEGQFKELDTDFQEWDANFQEISDIHDTEKERMLDKKTNSNNECSYLTEENKSIDGKEGEVKELGAVSQDVVLENGDLIPEVDEDFRGISSSGEQIPSLLSSSSDLSDENFVVSTTRKQTWLKSDNFPEGSKDLEGGNTLMGKFQELDHGKESFLEKATKYEFSLETLLLSQDTSLCQFSELTDQSQMSVHGTEFPSFLEESKKETFYQEIEEAEASDTEEELIALQRDVNLSCQDDTIFSGLVSFDRTLEASDWLEDDGRENEMSIKSNGADLVMEGDMEVFSKERKTSHEKEVYRDGESEFQDGSNEVRTGFMEENFTEKSNIPSLFPQTDFDKSSISSDSDRLRTTKGDGPVLTSLASCDNESTEMVDEPRTGDLIDFSPIKPTSLNLTNGRTDGQMPKWLEQQLQASSPAGTKTKRTINIHEAGLSHIEDMNSVMSVKEITEKASLVVKRKLIEQAKQPLRSSTPVQELEENDNYVNVDNLCQKTGDSPHSDENSQTIGATKEAVETCEDQKRSLKLPNFARSTSVGDQEFVDPETGECREDDDIIKPSSLIQSASLSNLHKHGLNSHDSPRKAYSAVDLIDNARLNTGEYSAFNLLKNLDESISKSDSNVYNSDCRNGPSPIPELEKHDEGKCAYCGSNFENEENVKESLSDDFKKYVEIQAKVHAARQVYDVDVVTQGLRIIDKDVPRTDRELAYFRGNENPNLLKLRDALITYAFFHPDVGYAQGMNDIMSRFFVVMDSEADAYWMFCNYMEHFKGDFMENDMLRKISLVEQLLMKMDRELYDFLQGLQMELIFCHRWLLLTFKREFSYKDGLRIFEIISSRHLEVSSLEAEMERSRERARELEKDEGSRMEEIYVSPEYSFDVFVCVAMLHECRDRLMSTNDVASIYQLMASLPKVNDLDTILSRAEDLFFKYCRKSTVDCFQVIDEPIERALSWKQRLHIDF